MRNFVSEKVVTEELISKELDEANRIIDDIIQSATKGISNRVVGLLKILEGVNIAPENLCLSVSDNKLIFINVRRGANINENLLPFVKQLLTNNYPKPYKIKISIDI